MQLHEAITLFMRVRLFEVRANTAQSTAYQLRKLRLYFGEREVSSITLDDILEYIQYLRKLGFKPNTFVAVCAYLRKFFRFLAAQGYTRLNANLIPMPRPEMKPARVATEEAYRKLLALVPDSGSLFDLRNRCFLNLLWDTGARIGEIISLDVYQMDLGRKRAVISTEKSRGRRPFREIFWTNGTNENLRLWLDARGRMKLVLHPEALFLCVAGHNVGRRLAGHAACEVLRKLSEKAQIPSVNAHSFRHRMGHHIIKQGATTVDVMNILGHSNLDRSAIYTMMVDRELEERYRKFRAGFRSNAGQANSASGLIAPNAP